MGDKVKWDENVEFHYNNPECGAKVGEMRLVTRLKRQDYVDSYSGNDRSEWAMAQKGHYWPLSDNPDQFNWSYDYFGDQYKCWYTHWAELTQNWNKSDLNDLGVEEYQPSYSDETKETLNFDISASAPLGASVSVSLDAPKLEIQSKLKDNKLRSTYNFTNDMGGRYDAADEDVQLGTTTAFDSLKPEDGDKIVPTYMYGSFKGFDLVCEQREACQTIDQTKKGGSIHHSFYENKIDDL